MPSSAETGPLSEDRSELWPSERVVVGIDKWGDAFLAYLLLPDVDLRARDIESRFTGAYAGCYETRSELINRQIEVLGWTEALVRFRFEEGIGEGVLEWSYDALWALCVEAYDVVEVLGGIHVFRR